MPVYPDAEIEISAFAWVPPFAQGVVRDLRVRLALTERPADYLREQPFGQVPIYNEGDVHMFETGAIVLRIAGDRRC